MRCLHKPLRLSDLFLSAVAIPHSPPPSPPRLTPCKLPAQRLHCSCKGNVLCLLLQTPPKAHNWNELIVRKRRPFSWLELSAPVFEEGGAGFATYAMSEHKQCQLLDEISGVKVYVQLETLHNALQTWHETLTQIAKLVTANFRFSYFLNELCPVVQPKDMLIISESIVKPVTRVTPSCYRIHLCGQRRSLSVCVCLQRVARLGSGLCYI